MSNKLTAQSFKDLEESKSNSVWVYNNTKPKGRVHLHVMAPNGRQIHIVITNTWIPIDLTTMATRQSLLESADLRKLWSTGKIKLITPETAERFMRNADAMKESARIERRTDNIQVGDFEVTGADKEGSLPAPTNEPSLRVVNMTGDMDEETNIANLRTNADEMTVADLKYLVQNSTQPKLKALAAEMLAEHEEA